MEVIWIIGLGQFGQIAFQRLSQSNKNRHFVLVDPDGKNLAKCAGSATTRIKSDGVAFLETNLTKGHQPAWIIPALPIHLAAEWFLRHLGPERLKRTVLPSEIESLVPNPVRGSDGNIYASHAGFRCPDDCDEPQDFCTVTGDVRKENMYELLENLEITPFEALIIRSHQLGKGIGGYRPEKLLELKEKVAQASRPVLVSTACRCHGVITGLEPI